MKKDHRGISLGTYVMLGVTGAVLLGCFLILPGLLGQARGTVDVGRCCPSSKPTECPRSR